MPSVKNQDKRDMDGIIGNVNDNKTKCNSFLLKRKRKNWQKVGDPNFRERERESAFSLDFLPFESSVLDGARSKVVLCSKSYAWTPIWWSSDNLRGRDLFLLVLFFG